MTELISSGDDNPLVWQTRGRWACAWPVDEVESARQSEQTGYHVLGCKRNVINPENAHTRIHTAQHALLPEDTRSSSRGLHLLNDVREGLHGAIMMMMPFICFCRNNK
jgi:hypothetical protein